MYSKHQFFFLAKHLIFSVEWCYFPAQFFPSTLKLFLLGTRLFRVHHLLSLFRKQKVLYFSEDMFGLLKMNERNPPLLLLPPLVSFFLLVLLSYMASTVLLQTMGQALGLRVLLPPKVLCSKSLRCYQPLWGPWKFAWSLTSRPPLVWH